MHGGRGAKGSLNDRIISYLFRKRYKEFLKKKGNYTKEERQKAIDYLKKIKELDIENNLSMLDSEDKKLLEERFKDFNINDISISNSPKNEKLKKIANGEETFDIKDASSLISDYDPSKELYDFDNYDFVDAVTSTTKLSKEDSYGILDVDKEIKKREDEKNILKEVTEFVDESKKLLEEMSKEIEFLKSEVDKQYTQEQLKEIKFRYDKLNEKISKLRKQYYFMKEKYEFEGYDLLENITLIENIEDFKTKADLEELELMVDACKYEVEAIDSVVIENKKAKKVGIAIEDKKNELVDRDNSFDNAKEEKYRLDNLNKTIEEELKNESIILEEIKKQLNSVENETRIVRGLTLNTDRMVHSFLRITAGIITAPLFNIFGTMLGIHLVRSGLRELRDSLIPEEVNRVEYIQRFNNVERQILNAKDDVERTLIIINDSFDTIKDIKKIYKDKFEKYASYIPEYNKLWNDMENLEKRLLECKNRVNDYKTTLDENYQKNAIRVYNATH